MGGSRKRRGKKSQRGKVGRKEAEESRNENFNRNSSSAQKEESEHYTNLNAGVNFASTDKKEAVTGKELAKTETESEDVAETGIPSSAGNENGKDKWSDLNSVTDKAIVQCGPLRATATEAKIVPVKVLYPVTSVSLQDSSTNKNSTSKITSCNEKYYFKPIDTCMEPNIPEVKKALFSTQTVKSLLAFRNNNPFPGMDLPSHTSSRRRNKNARFIQSLELPKNDFQERNQGNNFNTSNDLAVYDSQPSCSNFQDGYRSDSLLPAHTSSQTNYFNSLIPKLNNSEEHIESNSFIPKVKPPMYAATSLPTFTDSQAVECRSNDVIPRVDLPLSGSWPTCTKFQVKKWHVSESKTAHNTGKETIIPSAGILKDTANNDRFQVCNNTQYASRGRWFSIETSFQGNCQRPTDTLSHSFDQGTILKNKTSKDTSDADGLECQLDEWNTVMDDEEPCSVPVNIEKQDDRGISFFSAAAESLEHVRETGKGKKSFKGNNNGAATTVDKESSDIPRKKSSTTSVESKFKN